MKENNDINNYNNQNIINKKEDNQIDNEISTEELLKFKNKFKELFNEFSSENNKKLNPSIPTVNFSEIILELDDGWIRFSIFLGIIIICVILIIVFFMLKKIFLYIIPIPGLIIIIMLMLICRFKVISPGEALILSSFGKYIGTCKKSGFFWIYPCTQNRIISLKSNHYNGNMIKVNDKDGTPVLIGLVCIWRIRDTVKAYYCVRNIINFITGQSESAIRYVASKFSYDSTNENELTLKSGSEDINILLKLELQRRTKNAGIEIEDARITEISYGKEIATMMLQKQTADALISSKQKISKGVVEIIDDSIKEIERRNICHFKDEEKSKLVSDLMAVYNIEKDGSVIIEG